VVGPHKKGTEMAKLSIGQKAERVLKLLLGLRNARVAETLRQYGFKDSDLAEGWRLLQRLTDGRLQQRGPAKQDPALLAQLDAWENHWFPIAGAALRGRFPEVHEWLFLNLSQTEGPGVVVTVGTLLTRLDKLASEPALGERGAQARELLRERGLSDNTLQLARNLLQALGSVAPSSAVSAPADSEQQETAERALWSWYLEWAEIARVAVKDRRLLRDLGFLNYKRPVSDDEEPEEESASANGGVGA